MKEEPPSGRSALTLVEVLVIVAVVAVLGLYLFASRHRVSNRVDAIVCQNNLKQVGLAFYIWAGDNDGRFPMSVSMTNGGTKERAASGLAWPHFLVMSNELNTPIVLSCPTDKGRGRATNWSDFDDRSVSYFVGVDAVADQPRMLLAGERYITRGGVQLPSGLQSVSADQDLGWSKQSHVEYAGSKGRKGHIVLVGSEQELNHCFVETVDPQGMRDVLEYSGAATNRLAIP